MQWLAMATARPHLGPRRLLMAFMLALLALGAQAGDVEDRDPFERWNRPVHQFNVTLDQYLLAPVARGYAAVMPDVLQQRVSNFFSNLSLPISVIGGVLQADPEKAVTDASRFAFNSTIGIGGLFDPATAMGMPAQNEDIGQALEVWGLEDSPFLILPFLGPTTVVEIPDRVAWFVIEPYIVGDHWPDGMWALRLINMRAGLLDASSAMSEMSADNYVLLRESYLERRAYLRHDGDPPVEDDFDDFFGGDDF